MKPNSVCVAVLLFLVHLPLSRAAAETILRVPADYPTIQAAVDAAGALPDSVAVRVAGGHYVEHVNIHDLPAGAELVVSGSWNASYDFRDGPPSIIDGAGVGPVVKVTGKNLRELQLIGFTIVGGSGAAACGGHRDGEPAGGIYVSLAGNSVAAFLGNTVRDLRLTAGDSGASAVQMLLQDNAQVTFHRNFMTDNHLIGPGATGAGMRAVLRDSAFLNMELDEFVGNRVRATDHHHSAAAAGADLRVLDHGKLLVGRVLFQQNEASAAGRARYAAMTLRIEGIGSALIGGNKFLDNRTRSDRGDASGTVLWSASSSGCGSERAVVTSDRDTFRGNLVGNRAGHVLAIASDQADVSFRDALIAKSDGDAILASARSGGTNTLTNLTIADHAGNALRVPHSASGGITYLSNSILFGNGVDSPAGSPVQTANLVGVNPQFVDQALGDYHLQAGSLAVDAGNDTPPGGLGMTDLDNVPRPKGLAVDIGAYEQHMP